MTTNKHNEECCDRCLYPSMFDKAFKTRFWGKTRRNGECIEWTAGLSATGYGILQWREKQWFAHRIGQALKGRHVPHGRILVTDHLCRNRKCVNIRHLELVSVTENVLRGESFSACNKRKLSCDKGHLFSRYGGVTKNGHRKCLSCETTRITKNRENIRIYARKWYKLNKSKAKSYG